MVTCPLCGYEAEELRLGRRVGKCPKCVTYGRHRILWFWLKKEFELEHRMPAAGVPNILHCAPSPGLKNKIREYLPACGYNGVDNGDGEMRGQVDEFIDLTSLPFADDSFDLIICLHVLEHIQDDRKAIRELRRVLKPTGAAVIQVPMFDIPETIEDPKVTTPEGRLKAFGQEDHVRKVGRDYWDRLRECGLDLSDRKEISMPAKDARKYAITTRDVNGTFTTHVDLWRKLPTL